MEEDFVSIGRMCSQFIFICIHLDYPVGDSLSLSLTMLIKYQLISQRNLDNLGNVISHHSLVWQSRQVDSRRRIVLKRAISYLGGLFDRVNE
jgi:hypothetical protein